MRTLTLYVARACHLCDEARKELAPLRDELGFELAEIDITGDPELEAAHRQWLPVGELDGERVFVYRVDEPALRAGLAAAHVVTGGAALPRQNGAHVLLTPIEEAQVGDNRVGVGVAARLSRYLQVLSQAKKMGKDSISSQEIADYTKINATQIRRDLSKFGNFGKRGVGYSIDALLEEVRKILRTQGQHNIALVGAGRLGEAIVSSPIFAEHGIRIAAVFDSDESKVGTKLAHVEVTSYSELKDVVRDNNIVVGVLAVPAEGAQRVADDLVDAGVRILVNYSEALLDVPGDVTVHTLNPAVELLHALYFHLT